MKAPDWPKCSECQLWKYVAWHLSQNGIDCVLVGGAVASIYSQGAYRSGDLDFIIPDRQRTRVGSVLEKLGFQPTGRHFIHPDCPHLFLEFPPGPLAIGSDYRIKPESVTVHRRQVFLLSPTDCVRDRLASYIHFKSRDTLEQALLVASSQSVDMTEIRNWCVAEGAIPQFEEFKALLKKRHSKIQ